MTYTDLVSFEIHVMDLCDAEGCKTAEEYEKLSELLHEHLELAIQDMCTANGIEDYDPLY